MKTQSQCWRSLRILFARVGYRGQRPFRCLLKTEKDVRVSLFTRLDERYFRITQPIAIVRYLAASDRAGGHRKRGIGCSSTSETDFRETCLLWSTRGVISRRSWEVRLPENFYAVGPRCQFWNEKLVIRVILSGCDCCTGCPL
jgi:hypothetical protein